MPLVDRRKGSPRNGLHGQSPRDGRFPDEVADFGRTFWLIGHHERHVPDLYSLKHFEQFPRPSLVVLQSLVCCGLSRFGIPQYTIPVSYLDGWLDDHRQRQPLQSLNHYHIIKHGHSLWNSVNVDGELDLLLSMVMANHQQWSTIIKPLADTLVC